MANKRLQKVYKSNFFIVLLLLFIIIYYIFFIKKWNMDMWLYEK